MRPMESAWGPPWPARPAQYIAVPPPISCIALLQDVKGLYRLARVIHQDSIGYPRPNIHEFHVIVRVLSNERKTRRDNQHDRSASTNRQYRHWTSWGIDLKNIFWHSLQEAGSLSIPVVGSRSFTSSLLPADIPIASP